MKKIFSGIVILALTFGLFAAALAQPAALPPERLQNLTHNAPNTGIMLPKAFDPYEDTYLLTVASWVSRIKFTPTTSSPTSAVTVNGQPVASGQESPIIQMKDEPQEVFITVSAHDANGAVSAQTTYRIFLQRRPSERRTRVSAGYINEITIANGVATINADLVTISYQGISNVSTFSNQTVDKYKYETAPNCLFYVGTFTNPIRVKDAQEFINGYWSGGSNLYYLVYMEDQIVAVFPYNAG